MHKSTNNVIYFTVAGTAALYASFAALILLDPVLLPPAADPRHPALSAVLMALTRGISDFVFAAAIATAIYLSFRLLAKMHWFRSRRIARKIPDQGQMRRETLLTANFAIAAGIQGVTFLVLAQLGILKIYPAISDRGWLSAISSLALFLVLTDAWFYLCHRVYHYNRFVFRRIHAVHHLSVVTTPMTNSQISPWELVPSALFSIVYLMIVPMAWPLLSLTVIVVNLHLILLHSGYEIFPRGTSRHWLGKWLVTPTYHQMHHELFVKHMGLYFNWFDRLFGTYSDQYSARFDEITTGTLPRPAESGV